MNNYLKYAGYGVLSAFLAVPAFAQGIGTQGIQGPEAYGPAVHGGGQEYSQNNWNGNSNGVWNKHEGQAENSGTWHGSTSQGVMGPKAYDPYDQAENNGSGSNGNRHYGQNTGNWNRGEHYGENNGNWRGPLSQGVMGPKSNWNSGQRQSENGNWNQGQNGQHGNQNYGQNTVNGNHNQRYGENGNWNQGQNGRHGNQNYGQNTGNGSHNQRYGENGDWNQGQNGWHGNQSYGQNSYSRSGNNSADND